MTIANPAVAKPASQKLALAIGLGLLIAAQQLLVVPGNSLLSHSLHDALHLPWFFALTWLLRLWFKAWMPTMLAAAGLAVVTEGMQLFTGREPQLGDLARNGLGMLTAWLAWMMVYRPERRVLSALAAAFIISAVASPVAFALASRAYMNAHFPVLLDMTDIRGHALARATTTWRTSPDGIHLTIDDKPWPGVHLTQPQPSWADCEHMLITVSADDAGPLDLFVGLLLKPGDGITNFSVRKLFPGQQTVRVPLAALRPTLHAPVYDVFVYTTGDYAGRELVIHRVWLE